MERRRVPRYSAHVKASIKLPGESAALAVMVEDLCVLGCLLEYAPTLEIHQECDFAMTWKGREFRTPAVVAWKGERTKWDWNSGIPSPRIGSCCGNSARIFL